MSWPKLVPKPYSPGSTTGQGEPVEKSSIYEEEPLTDLPDDEGYFSGSNCDVDSRPKIPEELRMEESDSPMCYERFTKHDKAARRKRTLHKRYQRRSAYLDKRDQSDARILPSFPPRCPCRCQSLACEGLGAYLGSESATSECLKS